MTTNKWRGDAASRSKLLRLIAPGDTQAQIQVLISVGNKSLAFNRWNASEIIAAINAAAWPELTGVTVGPIAGSSDISLSGPLDTDFDVSVVISPTLEIEERTPGRAAVNQQTRLTFDGATAGSFTLTVNGDTTAAIDLRTSGAFNTGGIVSAIEALTDFTTGDVAAIVSGSAVVLTWAGDYAAKPVAVVMDATELNNGGQIVIREVQAARPAAHDIWFMGSDRDFQFSITNGATAVTMKTNESESEMSEKLTAAWGARVDLYSHEIEATGIRQKFFIIDMVGFPGVNTTLSLSVIAPTESPAGMDLVRVIAQSDTTPVEVFLVDVRNGDELVMSYNGELIASWTSPSNIVDALNSAGQFTEWSQVSAIGAGNLNSGIVSPHLWLLKYVGDVGRITGSGDGGDDFENELLTYHETSAIGTLNVLQHGGPTNAADGAIHSVYLAALSRTNTIAGSWALEFAEGQTSALTEASDAAAVQAAIIAATGITVAVTGSGTAVSPFVIDYTGDLGNRSLPTVALQNFTGDGSGSAAISRSHVTAVSAVQIVRVSQEADGGTFQLKYGYHGPVEFEFDETAADFETKLETLSPLAAAGNVSVALNAASGEYVVTFGNELAAMPVETFFAVRNALTSASTDVPTKRIESFPTGPGNFAEPLNWSLSRAPISGDEIIIAEADTVIEYGLRQFVAVTANASTDILTAGGGMDFVNGQLVRLVPGSVTIGGLAAATDYYCVNVSPELGTFQLSATATGSPINLTSAGTGPHYVGVIADNLLIPASFDGSIGLIRANADGYDEYREKFLCVGIAATGQIEVGKGSGAGSGLLRIDIGNSVGQVTAFSTAQSDVDGFPGCILQAMTSAGNLLIHGGEIGLAPYDDDVAMIGSFNVLGGSLAIGNATIAGNAISAAGTLTTKRMAVSGLVQIN